ncbi:hypothetical protein SADUNF_Sadunf11G0015100 [Salix dunnii]|uniref:Gnk2-homologous domain-containing protein n=1 Tax=Salix dunnii TaxID=1413687 RepID=A0A835JM06_9ROSI|nr:hypothetical protein SADUNF_Sadunf11G0015100 [Salix dunnii]
MGSKTTVSLLLHLIVLSITLTDALKCYTTGNFTANSTYAKNRDLVLSSLASNVTANGGFYNTTIGSGNDTVYGLVHCMASPSAGNCSFCVNSAMEALMTACPNQKEAISWGGDPVPCIVRYANRYFFGSLELSPSEALYNTGIIEATFTQFGQIWSGFRDIVTRASTNSSRLAEETTDLSSTQKIYVFMQCTPDVSQSNCGVCLQQSVDYYKSCCYGQQGGVVQTPNWKEHTTSRTIIVTTVPTAILLALVILIITIFRFRKPKQEAWRSWRKGTPLDLIDPILRGESTAEMMRCIHIGLLCVQENVADRPTMASVVLMLSTSSYTLQRPSQPAYFFGSRTNQPASSMTMGYKSRMDVASPSQLKTKPLSRNDVSLTEFHPR